MNLNEYLNAIDFRIKEGGKFLWKCFGENVWSISTETDYGYSSCVYDMLTLKLYQVDVFDKVGRGNEYVWTDPEYISDYVKECKKRNVIPFESSDGDTFTITDSADDILEKVSAILNNRSFNTDVIMNVDVDDDALELLEKKAKEENKTVDEVFVDVLRAYIDEQKELKESDPL